MEKIKYLVIDVDGTMTDAGIYYDEHGNELKKFCTKDAIGFFAAKAAGIKTVVITGRECMATLRRMKELEVDYLYQNVRNKMKFLRAFMDKHHIPKEAIGYIGDDINDLAAMSLVGFVACPKDSCQEVLERSSYISMLKGGEGAVREIIECMLKEMGEWAHSISVIIDTDA